MVVSDETNLNLTLRQLEICSLKASGHKQPEIATELGCASSTVKNLTTDAVLRNETFLRGQRGKKAVMRLVAEAGLRGWLTSEFIGQMKTYFESETERHWGS